MEGRRGKTEDEDEDEDEDASGGMFEAEQHPQAAKRAAHPQAHRRQAPALLWAIAVSRPGQAPPLPGGDGDISSFSCKAIYI